MMTPDAVRSFTLALLERDRETFLAGCPSLAAAMVERDADWLAPLIAETFAAGFAYGTAAGLEVSRELKRNRNGA